MPDGNGLETLPPDQRETARPAGDRDLGPEHDHDGDPGDRGGRLRLPSQSPFDLPDLMKRAARALDQKRRATPAVRPVVEPASGQQEDLPLVGRTPSMQALYRLVARVMNTELPVLITGESGTGEKPDRAGDPTIFSDRRTLPFVVAAPSDLEGMDGPLGGDRAGQGRLDPFSTRWAIWERPRRARSCACSTPWATARRA